jgi:circadian clock protein KaiC
MYLAQHGVSTLLVMAQHSGVAAYSDIPAEASYLADAVIVFRYFEAFGEVRQAISVVKKRSGNHERTIRELKFNGEIRIGDPIRNFLGVLSGSPQFVPDVPEIAIAK